MQNQKRLSEETVQILKCEKIDPVHMKQMIAEINLSLLREQEPRSVWMLGWFDYENKDDDNDSGKRVSQRVIRSR